MKKMQKVFALILTASMLIAVLSGCSARDPDDRGAHIHMYLAADPSNLNLDPAKMLYSAETIKFIGLIFEGLTVMDDNGKLHGGMAKKWTIIEDDEKEIYKMQFELKTTF
jgi:ABC-type oligopeptide transport system substrate-binding subunit